MFQAYISRVDVDATISIGGSIFFLKTISHLFNVREIQNGNEALERNEVTEKKSSHLPGVIVGEIEREFFADRVGLPKGRTELLYSLAEEVIF
jgi:hypothetical protein